MQTLKLFLAKILCSKPIGILIGLVFSNQIPFFNVRINTDSPHITPGTKAKLYWNIYERAEARFISKHLKQELDVVELGSSIGAISSLAGKVSKGNKIICVEANPDLVGILEKNLSTNGIDQFNVYNVVIGDPQSDLWFNRGNDNISSYISLSKKTQSQKIKAILLSQILDKEALNKYQLICDIEGSEIDILLNDPQALEKCELIIIETHIVERNGKKYSPDDLREMIEKLNFSLIDQHGVNFVFSKNYGSSN